MKSKMCLTLIFYLLIPCAVNAKVSIVGGLTHERAAPVGETYRGVISIRNIGDQPQEVRIYQTDYLFFCDGTSVYDVPGQVPRSNVDWIAFSPKRAIIPPQEEVAVNYTVKVPDDRPLSGTYWSMLMVEEISKSSPEAPEEERGEVRLNIRQVWRYGIQMVTHIGDTGSRKLEFLDTKLLRDGEGRTLQVDIENIGERWLRPLLWAELYNQEGSFMGRFEGECLRIYPGTSARYRVDLSEVPKGAYKALVVADCGGDDLFGATYTFKLER